MRKAKSQRVIHGESRVLSGILGMMLLVVTGCATRHQKDSPLIPPTMRSVIGTAPVRDGRGRFREILCARLSTTWRSPDDTDCEKWLWRLPGEVSVESKDFGVEVLDRRLRILTVAGAFSDCYPEAGRAFAGLADGLRRQGYLFDSIPVSGRSSSQFNARLIHEFLSIVPTAPDRPLILVGYSKGASDILEMLRAYPDDAAKIAAVVSVAGSINGSPLAERYAHLYDRYLSKRRLARCPIGDGGVIDSLRNSTRLEWLARGPLPAGIRYYSVGTFTTPDRLARALTYTYRILSRIDVRNDGQLLTEDQLIPGSTLLGYANADHWAVATRLEDDLPFWAHRKQGIHAFPQDILLESILIYVQQDFLLTEKKLSP